jgi:ribosomal protein L24
MIISITPIVHNFNKCGSSVTLTINSDTSWVSRNINDNDYWELPSWININGGRPNEITGSAGVTTYIFNADPNTSGVDRTFTFSTRTSDYNYSYYTYSQITPTISITRYGSSYLGDGNTWTGSDIINTNGNVANSGFSVVTSNSAWMVSSDSSWLLTSVNNNVYITGGILIVTCLENTGEPRVGKLTFTTEDGAVKVLTFNQAKKNAISIDYTYIGTEYMGNDTIQLPYQLNSTGAIKINSCPQPFSASITKGSDWLKFHNNIVGVYLVDSNLLTYNGGFNIDTSENVVRFDRTGEITVTSGVSVKKITVNQKASERVYNYATSLKYVNVGNIHDNSLILQYTPMFEEFNVGDTITVTSGPYNGKKGTIWYVYYGRNSDGTLNNVRNLYLDIPITATIPGCGSFIREKQFNYTNVLSCPGSNQLIISYKPIYDEFAIGNNVKILTGIYAGKTSVIHIFIIQVVVVLILFMVEIYILTYHILLIVLVYL